MLPVAPSRAQRFTRRCRRLSEGGYVSPAFLRERIAARWDLPPVVESPPPRNRERNEREAAQPWIVAATVNSEALNPVFCSAWSDPQLQRRIGPVHARCGE